MVQHLPIRMKGGEMNRHLRSQIFHHPLRQRLQFRIGVVLARNQQSSDFEPDPGFALEVDQRIQHWLQVTTANFPVKLFAERLEVYIGSVHVLEEFAARLIAQITGSDCY